MRDGRIVEEGVPSTIIYDNADLEYNSKFKTLNVMDLKLSRKTYGSNLELVSISFSEFYIVFNYLTYLSLQLTN